MKNLFIFVFCLMVLALGCSEEPAKLDDQKGKEIIDYGIQIVSEIIEDTSSLYRKVDKIGFLKQPIKLEIDTLDFQNNFIRIYGYHDKFSASADAFLLKKDSIFVEPKIIKDSTELTSEYEKFLFLGRYLDRPAIFSYDLLSNKIKLIWQKWGKKILKFDLNQSSDKAFFVSALRFGNVGTFPYASNVELFHYEKAKDKIKKIDTFGNGLKIDTKWINDSTYSSVFTFIDSVLTSKVIQDKRIYSQNGKRNKRIIKQFDLEKDGIPLAFKNMINLNSPNSKYFLRIMEDDSKNLEIVESKTNKINHIAEFDGKLIKVGWFKQNYLIVAFEKPLDKFTEVIIYDISNSRMKRSFQTKNLTSFELYGGLLGLTIGTQDSAYIKMFDIFDDTTYVDIKLKGGCGIKNIPKFENVFY